MAKCIAEHVARFEHQHGMRPETCCKSEDKDEEGIQNRVGMKRRGLHEVKRCKDHKATAGLSVVKGGGACLYTDQSTCRGPGLARQDSGYCAICVPNEIGT